MPTARVLDALQVLVPLDEGGDGECLQRFLAGRDEAAFAELVRRHGPMVYGACRRILANGPEADDAFQASFFVLARKADTIRGNVRSWLYGVAVRVAHKARVQAVRRRVRQMAAAKPEAVLTPAPDADLWAVLDEELAKLPEELRQAVLACDVNGLSRSRAAAELGWPEGTVAKRLTKARETLAARLTRRGISLGVGPLSFALAERATAAVPGALLLDTARQAVAFALGGGGSLAVQTLAESVMRSLKMGVLKVWFAVGLVAVTLAGGSLMLAGGPDEKPAAKGENKAEAPATKAATMWKERYAVNYSGSLPVSVAYSADGKTLLTGDTNGEAMALTFTVDEPQYRWKSKVGGSHAAVAYSADHKTVYVTAKDGVRILDAADGKEVGRLEAKDSNPISLGVFPNKVIAEDFTQSKIVFGNSRGYFIKSWADGKLPDTVGTIETSTVAKGATPADAAAVPLAVDPKGRSAIMTGPRDGTGQFTGTKGKNVLWAYVCGDYEKGSPGNRVMAGHDATVVSAAWAKDGGTAVTGDADGRVIVWDAKTMKEARRVELGGRVGALAISDDGQRAAAYVLGKAGEVFVWDSAKPTNAMKPIHTDLSDFGGTTNHASLSFAPDGRRLAGCAIDKKWLNRTGKLAGKVRVWELAAEPKAQLPPKHLYTKELPKGSSANFVIQHNHVMIMPSAKEGAIDYRDPKDGSILSRLVVGKFSIGRIVLSPDKRWLAMEQHETGNGPGLGLPSTAFVAAIWDMKTFKRDASIPGVSHILDVGEGRTAIVREKKIEIWDNATCKLQKTAPFPFTRIDAARFSPDGKLLALNDQNDLILWRWTENAHERIELGRSIGSLAFSPDGKFLAEGPSPRDSIQLRDVATREVVHSLRNGAKQSLDVPRMAFAQGGRLLIAANAIHLAKEISVPHRIHLWDTQTGGIAHEIAIPSGFPRCIDVSPNGRYLVATIEDEAGLKLSAWEIDGESTMAVPPGAWREGKLIPSPNNGPVTDVAVSPDGKMLAVVANESVAILDPATGTRLDKGRVANLKVPPTKHGIAFSPRGKLAVTSKTGVNAFEDLLAEVPRFTQGTTDAVPGFDTHQVVWLEDDPKTGNGRLVATDGTAFQEFGWKAITENRVERIEKFTEPQWESWKNAKHKPAVLAAGKNRLLYSADNGPDEFGDRFNVYSMSIDAKPRSVVKLAGHKARPTDGAVSPDGKLFLSGDEAGDLIVWDGTTFKKTNHWKLGGAITKVAIAPDGKTAAVLRVIATQTGTTDETDFELYIFDSTDAPANLKPIWKTPKPFPWTYAGTASLAFHPSGTKLYGAFADPYFTSDDKKQNQSSGIRVWENVPAGTPPPAATPAAAVSPPAAKLTWKAEEPIADPQFDIQSLAYSKDGTKFAICSNGETLVYDAATRKKLYSASGCFPQFVKSSLFTWALVVTEYDAGTGKLIKQYPEAKTEFGWQIAAISSDGKTAAGFDGSQIQLRDVATGFEPVRLARQARPGGGTIIGTPGRGVAWSPDGASVAGFHAAAERGGAGGLAIWNAKTGELLARREANLIEFNGRDSRFAFSPDGKTIAVGGLTGDGEKNSSLTILDAATMKNARDPVSVSSRDGGADVTAIAYSPDGGTIAIGVKLHTGKAPLNRVQLYDAETLELGVHLLPPHETTPITGLAFAPDGRTLIGTTGEGPFSEPQKKETLHRVLIWRGEPAK